MAISCDLPTVGEIATSCTFSLRKVPGLLLCLFDVVILFAILDIHVTPRPKYYISMIGLCAMELYVMVSLLAGVLFNCDRLIFYHALYALLKLFICVSFVLITSFPHIWNFIVPMVIYIFNGMPHLHEKDRNEQGSQAGHSDSYLTTRMRLTVAVFLVSMYAVRILLLTWMVELCQDELSDNAAKNANAQKVKKDNAKVSFSLSVSADSNV